MMKKMLKHSAKLENSHRTRIEPKGSSSVFLDRLRVYHLELNLLAETFESPHVFYGCHLATYLRRCALVLAVFFSRTF